MPPRKKRTLHPPVTTSNDIPSTDPRFPTEHLRLRFEKHSYIALKNRYLNKSFFTRHCLSIVEIIDYYQLDKLVYCNHPVNIDLCAQFYNNLVRIDDTTFSTRVAERDFRFSSTVLNDHLGLRSSTCPFLCYPSQELPFADPYSHISLDTIHIYLFGEERNPVVTDFRSLSLRVQDYILYRILTTCILPVTSRDVSTMRPSHSFFLYALCHRLDIDISLHMFHNIIYASSLVTKGRVHMPYCHILTSLFAAIGIDVSQGTLTPLSEYDSFGPRHLALVHIGVDAQGDLSWRRGAISAEGDEGGDPPVHAPEAGDAAADVETEIPEFTFQEPIGLSTSPTPGPWEERLTRLEESSSRLEHSLSSLRQEVTTGFQRMEELILSLRLTHPPPPPPPDTD